MIGLFTDLVEEILYTACHHMPWFQFVCVCVCVCVRERERERDPPLPPLLSDETGHSKAGHVSSEAATGCRIQDQSCRWSGAQSTYKGGKLPTTMTISKL